MAASPEELKQFLKDQRDQASNYVSEWNDLEHRFPELILVETEDEWKKWLSSHQELNIDANFWTGKQIQDLLDSPPGQDELSTPQIATSLPGKNILGGVFTAAAGGAIPVKNQRIENDKQFRSIKKQMMKSWLLEHNQKDFNSKEGQEFLYGTLEGNSQTLNQKVFEEFKKQDMVKNEGKKLKQYQSFKAENYPLYDPAVSARMAEIKTVAKKRFALLQKTDPKIDYEEVLRATKQNIWQEFAHMYNQKAQKYAQQNKDIKIGLDKQLFTKLSQESALPVQSSGFQQRKAEKEQEKQQASNKPSASDIRRFQRFEGNLRPVTSQPTLQTAPKPSVSTARPPSGGPITRATNAINNLPRLAKNPLQSLRNPLPRGFGNPLSRLGGVGRAGGMAARGAAALFSTPVGWGILIAIGVIFLIIIIIAILIKKDIIKPGSAPIASAPSTSGDISQCTFHNQGRSIRFGNPFVAQYIVSVSDKSGIPPAMIAAILAREGEPFMVSTNGDLFALDYDATRSSANAIGVMQLIPSTYNAVYNTFQPELSSEFGKSSVSLDTARHTYQVNDPIMRIASIRDSILGGTYELKRLKNRISASGPWDENTVRLVASRYHGGEAASLATGCSFGYCDDVWKGFSGCNPTSNVAGTGPVIELVNAVNAVPTCNSGVRSSNISTCNAAIPDTMNRVNDIRREFTISTNIGPTYVLQCVGFVQGVEALVNYPPLIRKGYARDYAYPPYPSGYTFIPASTPDIQPGDLAIWSIGRAGHIAYVHTVLNRETFIVAEANSCSPDCGIIRADRVISRSDSTLLGWLRRL